MKLYVHRAGTGEKVLCVHGSGGSGASWATLAEEVVGVEIIAPDRSNYGKSPRVGRSSLASEAGAIAELLDSPIHVLGHSYVGVLCLMATALRPDAVLSLTVVEPPALHLAVDNPAAAQLMDELSEIYPPASCGTPQEWINRWGEILGLGSNEGPLTAGKGRQSQR